MPGTNIGNCKPLDTQGMQPMDFFFEVSKGNIPGHIAVNVQGRRDTLNTNDGFGDIWSCSPNNQVRLSLGAVSGGPPVAAETVELFSTSALDVGNTVIVEGLTDLGVAISEVVTMNGTNVVTTANTFSMVNRTVQLTPTSLAQNINQGDIIARFSGSQEIQCCILAEFGVATNSQYRVPAGFTGYVIDSYIESSRTTNGQLPEVEFRGKVIQFGSELVGLNEIIDTEIDGRVRFPFPITLPIFEGSDIVFKAQTDQNNTRVRSYMFMVIVDNNL